MERYLQDYLLCGVSLFLVSSVLAQWISEYSNSVSHNSEAAGLTGQRKGWVKAQLLQHLGDIFQSWSGVL